MCCGHDVENCGPEWFDSALTAMISTTSAWNHSNFAVRDPVSELAMLDGACATFSHMFLGTKVDGHSTFPTPKTRLGTNRRSSARNPEAGFFLAAVHFRCLTDSRIRVGNYR